MFRSVIVNYMFEKLPGVLAAIATFSVSFLLIFAFGAPMFLIVIPIILSVLVGRFAQRQDRLDR